MYKIHKTEQLNVFTTFGKTEETAKKDVQTIKKWLHTQKHLPEIMGDTEILNFLQLNKFKIDQTKEKINSYYTVRSKFPEFFAENNPNLPQLQRVFDIAYIFNHPKPLNGISRVLFCKMKTPNTYAPRQMLKMMFNIFEIRLHEDCMVTDTFIMDMDNITFKDILKITPRLMYKIFSVYKNVWALRVAGVYLLNSPVYVSVWISIFKLLVKQKIMDRIQVHRDAQVMKEIFSKEDLPKEYGGDGPTLAEFTEMTRQKLGEYQDRFDKLDKMKVFD